MNISPLDFDMNNKYLKTITSDSNVNFLQVGETVECGTCHPEKFGDCKELRKLYTYECECKCHNNSHNKSMTNEQNNMIQHESRCPECKSNDHILCNKYSPKNMPNEKILKKAIEKAVKNGWKHGDHYENVTGGWLFDHDFIKAFFGKKKHKMVGRTDLGWGTICLNCHALPLEGKPIDTKYCWQWHLQQMVIEAEPLKYIERLL